MDVRDNNRRAFLIWMKSHGTLTPEQLVEYDDLQARSLAEAPPGPPPRLEEIDAIFKRLNGPQQD